MAFGGQPAFGAKSTFRCRLGQSNTPTLRPVIEDSNQFDGRYFVIEELDQDVIDSLQKFIIDNEVKNILFAITPSIANDAFILFIEDKLKNFDIKFTKIAQGVPTGVSLENVDILSLSKAIQSKVEI